MAVSKCHAVNFKTKSFAEKKKLAEVLIEDSDTHRCQQHRAKNRDKAEKKAGKHASALKPI